MDKEKKFKILTHVLVILITIMIMQFIYKGAIDNNFVNTFSFGSTISSIILSVVAIMYTFIDGAKNKEVGNKLIESADSISRNVISLNKFIEKLEGYNESLEIINDIKSDIVRLIDTNHTAISVWQELAMEGTKNQRNKIIDSEITVERELKFYEEGEIMKEFNLNNVVERLTYNIKSNLLFFILGYENNRLLNLGDFETYYNELLKSDDLPMYNKSIDLMNTLNVFMAFDLLKYSYDNYSIRVEYIDKELVAIVKKYIPEDGMFVDSSQVRYFGWVYNYFK